MLGFHIAEDASLRYVVILFVRFFISAAGEALRSPNSLPLCERDLLIPFMGLIFLLGV